MGLPRGLKPATGALLGLGAGFTVVSLSDADSEARRWVTATRSEILLTVLRRRLRAEAELGSQGGPAAQATSRRLYVVSGPDAHLTTLGRDRVFSHMAAVDERRVARLAVPRGCTLGTGEFSLLFEQQMLLRQPDAEGDNNGVRTSGGSSGSESSANGGLRPEPGGAEASQDGKDQQRSTWDNATEKAQSEEDPLPPPSAAQALRPISAWESLVLRATRAVLDGKQLDRSAIWALERALSGGGESVRASRSTADSYSSSSSSTPGDATSDEDSNNLEVPPPTADPAPSGGGCAFVLEIEQPASRQTRAGGDGDGDGPEVGGLCSELVAWGWSLVSRGLGSVLVR